MHANIAYFILRATMGVNLFLHGFTRMIGDYLGFINWMTKEFEASILPTILVKTFAWIISPIEVMIGICLILGFSTLPALSAGACLMAVLISGQSLIQHWDVVSTEMLYAFMFFFLLEKYHLNTFSLDEWRKKALN